MFDRLLSFSRALVVMSIVFASVLLSGCGVEAGDAGASGNQHISEAEYRLAKEAELRCIVGLGWSANLEPNDDGVTFGIVISFERGAVRGGDDPLVQEAQRDADDCGRKHSWEIELAYIDQHKLTGSEKEAMLDSLHKCFVDIPVDGALRSDSSKQLLRRAAEQYSDPNSREFWEALDCMNEHKWAITDQGEPD